jgi:ATP-dependent DNA helicase DinG
MRRRALESDVIIVNHHLFFADLAIKQQARAAPDAGVLPEAAAVIFDEAHELEDVASSYFGISLSNVRLEEMVRDVETMLRARQAYSTALKGCGEMLRERGRMFFAALPRGGGLNGEGRMPFEQREQFLEEHGDVYLAVMNALHRLEGELERLRGVEEAPGLKKRVADIREHLRFLMEAESVNTVFWIERRGGSSLRQGSRNTYLQATPIDVSALLSELLFEQYPSVILTSATLTVQGAFAHLRKRLGLRDARDAGPA